MMLMEISSINTIYYTTKITKEIEQKFVPMKEKAQELSKSKGQGIGD